MIYILKLIQVYNNHKIAFVLLGLIYFKSLQVSEVVKMNRARLLITHIPLSQHASPYYRRDVADWLIKVSKLI